MQALLRVAQRLRPQVIQTHAVKSHFLSRKIGLRRLAPWVAFHHGYTWTSARTRFYNQLDRWSLRAADRVLTVSVPFRDELVQKGVSSDRIEIIHNAIPHDWEWQSRTPERASALRASLGIAEECPVILIVGRLSAEKDHHTLLEAVARVRSKFEPHLVIVGEGPERNRIEQRIAQPDLKGRVTLTGQQKSAAPYYGIANVAVLSSRSEGSPNALLEAMAAQVPVVATRVGGIPEIVAHDESALLVDPGNVSQMSGAIARIFGDSGLAKRLAEQGYALIRTRHEPQERVQQLIRIYESIL
jgi:glycosyltransferase involved in cell wall biosynthesis